MGPRLAIGAAVAALPAAGSIAAATADKPCLAVLFAIPAFLALVIAPPAPYVPVLNRLPGIGSAPLEVVFRLNGSLDLSTEKLPNSPQVAVLEVGIANHSRWSTVKEAWINLVLPAAIRVYRSDRNGCKQDGGRWEEFVRHQLGPHPRADYWNDLDWTFPAQLSRVLRFTLLFFEAGEYPILFKLGAASHYGVEQSAVIRVTEKATSEDLSIEAKMGELILKAERLLRNADNLSDDALRTSAGTIFLEARTLTNEADLDPLPDRPPPGSSGRQYLKDYVRSDLRRLFVIRDELGRSRDPS